MRCPVLTFSFFSPPPKPNVIKTNINMNLKMAVTNKNSFLNIRVNIGEAENTAIKILL